MSKTVTRQDLRKLLGWVGLSASGLLLVATGLLMYGHNFSVSQVHSQLAQERIKFPAAGSAALDPKEFPKLQRYAGQLVDNGAKAKAYADEFIWVHMMKASGGKTYAEVSALSMASPSDQKLAGLKNVLFQGDMLRSSLLTAYAFSVFGVVAGYSATVALILAATALLYALIMFASARRRQ